MLRVKNTSTDRSKVLLHRKAAKLEMEPTVNGQRLRMGTSTDLSEDVYERNKPYFDKLVGDGVIEISSLGGPTIEKWQDAGYPPDFYPPQGWAEVPSEGLTAYRQKQADEALAAEIAAIEAAKAPPMPTAVVNVEGAARLEFADEPAPVDTAVVTMEPAGAPVEALPPPVVEEKVEAPKKGPSKKKLF